MTSVLAAKADEPGRVAGTLAFDDTLAGGPKVVIEFDVTLPKELKVAR